MTNRPKKKLTPNARLFSIIYLAVLTAFLGLLHEVHKGSTVRTDEEILRSINQTATPFWDNFYLLVTQLGGSPFIAPITIIAVLWLARKGMRYKALFTLISVAGAGLLNAALKLSVGRERPSLWQQLVNEHSYSFPSGHAMNSTALAISIIVLLWSTRWRWTAIIAGSVYVAIIGYSRLYLGVHYPTDIAGGWLVSILLAMSVAGLLYAHYCWRKPNPPQHQNNQKSDQS